MISCAVHFSAKLWLLWNLISLAFCQAIRECTPGPLCPSNVASEISSCTVTDDGTRSTIWSGNNSVFDCENNRITLSHGAPNDVGHCSAATVRLAPPNGNSYTSIISVSPSSEIDGAIIQCYYPTINGLIQECVLNITDPPGRPQCANANIETVTTNDPIDSVLVTLNWIEPLSEGDITGYSIIITPPLTIYPTECLEGSTSPCNVSSSVTSLQFHFNSSTPYTISVSAMNCDSQLGEPSVFGVNNLEEPRDIIRLNTVSVIYDQSSNELKTVTTSWYPTIPTTGSITGCGSTLIDATASYDVHVTRTGSANLTTESNFVPCCNYTYTPSEHSSNDYYSISVSAVNVVGRGRRVETPSIGSINSVLTVTETVAVSAADKDEPNVTLTCHFSSSFQGSSCDITLRTTTTMDLVLMARGKDGVPVHLNVGLNHDYYYTAAFNYEESGVNIVIQIEGQFTTCLCRTQESTVNEGCTGTDVVIAMSVIIPSTIMFITGLLLGLVIMYRVLRNKNKVVTDQPGHGHQLPGPTGGPLYDEISPTSVKSTEKFEMGENMAYAGPTTVVRNN